MSPHKRGQIVCDSLAVYRQAQCPVYVGVTDWPGSGVTATVAGQRPNWKSAASSKHLRNLQYSAVFSCVRFTLAAQ